MQTFWSNSGTADDMESPLLWSLKGWGGKEFCDVNNKSFNNQKRDNWGRGVKIVQNSMTSFMDDPWAPVNNLIIPGFELT